MLEGAMLPAGLENLPEPPARLFLHGVLPLGLSVAIVGTRHPTAEARQYAEELSGWLAERGVVVLSGGAKGIDAAAHRGALDAGGVTVVVAPSSFDRPYPAEHRELFDEVVTRGGGYLSCFEHGVEAHYHTFFQRNAILVALARAVILVEAPFRSGARNAAKWARRLARPFFVVPSPPWNERGRGCITELQLGARALGGPEEVLAALTQAPTLNAGAEMPAPLPRPRTPRPRPRRPSAAALVAPARDEASPAAAALRAIAAGARYADEVAEAIGASLPEVNHLLLLLTLSGEVEAGIGGELRGVRR